MSDETSATPFPVFRFVVSFRSTPADAPAHSSAGGTNPQAGTPGPAVAIAHGVFSEVTGLDATMEPKVIKEGGRNYGPVQRPGQVTFSTVVLKRGMTLNNDGWNWWYMMARQMYAYRLQVNIDVLNYDGTKVATYILDRAMPIKFKLPDLNGAGGSSVAIEELHLAHEGLRRDL